MDTGENSSLWRLLDTGVLTGVENMALDAILLQERNEGKSPNIFRFLQFSPPVVLIGYHQTVNHEVRVNYCNSKGIDINRRITGGGAIFFDESQLGWELVFNSQDLNVGRNLEDITKKVCEGAVRGLKKLGINAEFRPRNDIEVNGKKISGTGGVFEDNACLYQGTLLIDTDMEMMLKSLRIPIEKLTKRGIESARERVTSLKELLGTIPPLEKIKTAMMEGFSEELNIQFAPDSLTPRERSLLQKELEEKISDEWIYDEVREPENYSQMLRSIYKVDGGLLRVHMHVDAKRRYIKQVLITGDFFVDPARTIYDLEAWFKSTPIGDLKENLHEFFVEKQPRFLGLSENDIYQAISEALEKLEYVGLSIDEANSVFVVNDSFRNLLKNNTVLLLPYCAKLPDCEFRNEDYCAKCGGCSIGDAYDLGQEKNFRVISICSFEHLVETFKQLKSEGIHSYIGCCCEAFFEKRQKAFRESGLGGLLINIDNTTCYELGKEQEAYEGSFKQKTELKLELLKKIIETVGVPS
jgi:lipoate-protein ligase A